VKDAVAAFDKEEGLTRSEKRAWEEKISAAQAKATDAYLRLNAAMNAYNTCVQRERELTLTHNEAVGIVNDLAREIGRLAGTRKVKANPTVLNT
jgi:hypothetical protein